MKAKLDNPNAKTLSGLSEAERAHLAEMAALPEVSIDTSELPELSDEAWSASDRGRFYRGLGDSPLNCGLNELSP